MRRRTAFTLIEMLVVIGIIVLLVGIAAPMIYKAYKSGSSARLKADLATISTALEAYKGDHGDYPRAGISDAGAAILGKALVGPADQVHYAAPPATTITNMPPAYSAGSTYKAGDIVTNGNESSPGALDNIYVCLKECTGQTPPAANPRYNVYWTQVTHFDGADGPGFRVRPVINRTAQGKPVPPYLNIGRIAMRGLVFVDAEGNPILYFAGSPTKGDLAVADNGTTTAGGYLTVFQGANNYADPRVGRLSRFNLRDNISVFRRDTETDYANATKRIAGMLNDFGAAATVDSAAPAPNGAIDNTALGETAVSANYLLWCAGGDGLFGPEVPATIVDFKKDIAKCDDVTNFR